MGADRERTALDGIGRAPRLRRILLRGTLLAAELTGAVLRRLLDLLGAALLTIATAPAVVVLVAIAAVRRRPALSHRTFAGRLLRPIRLGELAAPRPLHRLPWVWAVLRGDLSWVGPEPIPLEDAERLPPPARVRFQVRPGLADLFRLRSAANIAFEGRASADSELVHTGSLAGDLGILARSLPALVLGGAPTLGPAPEQLDLLGVRVDNWTMDRAIAWLVHETERPRTVAFVNPDCLNLACTRPDYRAALARMDVVLPDGIGVHLACRMLGTPLAANVNGTDLFPRLCDALAGTGLRIFLLGGRPGVTDALASRLAERWPRLEIAGHAHGYFERGGDEESALVERIRTCRPHALLVAFGAPLQELWIDHWRDRLGVGVALGVGGLFDFYSGRIRRAPLWMREIGLEWVWRLLQEPRRMWRRYVIGNPLFLWRVWRWRSHHRL